MEATRMCIARPARGRAPTCQPAANDVLPISLTSCRPASPCPWTNHPPDLTQLCSLHPASFTPLQCPRSPTLPVDPRPSTCVFDLQGLDMRTQGPFPDQKSSRLQSLADLSKIQLKPELANWSCAVRWAGADGKGMPVWQLVLMSPQGHKLFDKGSGENPNKTAYTKNPTF